MNPAFPKLAGAALSINPTLLNNLLSTEFHLAKKGTMSRAFTDNINSFNVSNNFTFTAADDESRILAWLSPFDPQERHQDIRNERVDGVGSWLLKTKEFRSWYNGSEKDEYDRAVLFCYGDPGVGKSYISSLVVDYLCDQAMEQDMAVVCFYYDFASREEQTPTNMLCSLLKQLVSGLESVPSEIVKKFRGQKKVIGGRGLRLLDIVNMFPNVTSSQRTFICVDALDECVLKHQREVLHALGQILRRSPNTRMFMTGMSHIQETVERELGGRATGLSITPGDGDIATFLRTRLRMDPTPEVMDSELENDIMKRIPEGISETFLLASLKIEAILRETTIHRRRMGLNAMGDELGLGEAYRATLERIRAQGGEKAKLAMTTLMWICHSERPLQVYELCHALAVEIGSTHFNRHNVPAVETLLACCQGLVSVDKEASTVRLVHHTLQEYLSVHPNLPSRAHSTIAETCLTYLNSDQAKALSTEPQPDFSSMPFLKYCSRYWGTHANREGPDHVISLAMKLLGQHEKHIAAKSLFEQILDPDDVIAADSPSLFGGLHCASFFGIVEAMTALLGMKDYDINQRDSAGLTPLTWAVRGGHEEAVKLLLGQEEIDPEIPDNMGRTPVSWAAIKGHSSVVKQLLDRGDVNPDTPDNGGNTPLSWAAIEGHESVVKQLLDRGDVNPDRPDNGGNTPLSWAALAGYEAAVKLLLDREEVNPDKPCNEGYTPLFCAASKGHDSVVKLLLDREEVNPDKPSNEGYTPLYSAASRGRESVVKLLLDREEVNPDKPSNEGYTPLSCAASRGHGSVVKLLLDRKEVNPDKPNNEGCTPLFCAASEGYDSVVKLLLDQEEVNPDKPSNEGDTPLCSAASKGHESVVKLLLDREEVNPDKPSNEGYTPLSRAAYQGHELVVKLLLDREDVNPDKPNSEGITPLSRAAAAGHESVVKQFLGRTDVNPDRPDNKGRTPLSWAAGEGHEPIAALLLARQDVNPNRPDNSGHLPLFYASRKEHEWLVNLLQARNPEIPVHFEVDELRTSLPSPSL